jgi:hypothetical protein
VKKNDVILNEILNKTAWYFGIDERNILNRDRSSNNVNVRWHFINLLLMYGFKNAEISEFIKKDRTTILHSQKKHTELCKIYKHYLYIYQNYVEFMNENFSDFKSLDVAIFIKMADLPAVINFLGKNKISFQKIN